MTEQMAIESLKCIKGGTNTILLNGNNTPETEKFLIRDCEALSTAIKALEEIQQYKAIGTVEELQALKEKSVAKKPIEQGTDDKTIYKCSCGNVLMEKYSDGLICGFITDYCKVCGQKLLRADVDWE